MKMQSLLTKSLAVAALSFAVVGGSGIGATPAEAGFKKHHHHGFRVVIGAPLVYGGYGYGYRAYGHRSCGWLYRKATYTGSHYWWKRFHQCRYGW